MKNNIFMLDDGRIVNLFAFWHAFEKDKKWFLKFENEVLEISRDDFFKLQEFSI